MVPIAIASASSAGEQERRRAERDPRVEAVQPVAHHPPGDRPGDQIGDDHRLGELPGEQPDDVADAGAEHLPDADLLGPPLGGEGGEAEQAEAADDHRQQAKAAKVCARASSASYSSATMSSLNSALNGTSVVIRFHTRSSPARTAAGSPL